LATGLLGAGLGAGLFNPKSAHAAWPAAAFDAKTLPDALNRLLGTDQLIESSDIALVITDWAENGAVVPVTVTSTLSNIESITLLVDKNPQALVARFRLAKNVQAFIKTNIKMAETSHVVAVAKVGDKFYSARKKVKVTLNGCGN
jgi:sulfur-oxidizing protein SoxY